MPDGAADFDVISVVRRRRKWSSEQKLALVEEVDRPNRINVGMTALLLDLARESDEANRDVDLKIDDSDF